MGQIHLTLLSNKQAVQADTEHGFLRDGCYYTVSSGSGWEESGLGVGRQSGGIYIFSITVILHATAVSRKGSDV